MFDVGLGKKMIYICHEAPQGAMAHIIRAVHPFCAHLGKVANATFVNPGNQQNGLSKIWSCKSVLLDAPLGVVSSFEYMNMSTKVEIKRRKFPM